MLFEHNEAIFKSHNVDCQFIFFMKQDKVQDQTIWGCLKLIQHTIIKQVSSFNWKQD